MSYQVQPYTKQQAKRLGVEVAPSTKKGKKLDVYRDGELIASVGAKGYNDYPTYLASDGKAVADERRRLYHLRHTKNTLREKLARELLW